MISQQYKCFLFSMLLVMVGLSSCSQRLNTDQQLAGRIKITERRPVHPILKRNAINPLISITVEVPEAAGETSFKSIRAAVSKETLQDVQRLEIYGSNEKQELDSRNLISEISLSSQNFQMELPLKLKPGQHLFWISAGLKENADPDHHLNIKLLNVLDETNKSHQISNAQFRDSRIGIALRKPNDDDVNSYRIPGIVTTDQGTLISVYDARYKNSADLPGNIDVGMSRSKDGGKTWEAMKVIMDMGAPHENNGVGDPSVLFDPITKKIWVAALWSKGNRSIAGSGPGLSEEETGQFAVTSSSDDGLTWTKPYSITAQVKNPLWRLFFPGPGNGIAMADGKLVFPAQYWDEKKMPHSTLIYSDDHGQSWKAGLGAKSNTTESQLVETRPGTIMLNMRDNRGKFRSVATTTDMGQSWSSHPTTEHTLADPVCMGSLIKAKVKVKGVMKDVLFFSNPNSSSERKDLTIKASLDLGETWMDANQLLVDERGSFGYSALTKIDDHTLGILYEGIRDLYFVRIPVKDIIK